ncbi:hypothetical protein HDU88_001340, partial [Geranomyces variabilis]
NHLDKQDVLEQLNKAYETPKNKFIAAIHNFIYKEFLPVFKQDPVLMELWKISNKTNAGGNQDGSFYSKVLQRSENIILREMSAFLKSAGYSDDVLIFDGLQVRLNTEIAPVDADMLRKLEKHILKVTKFDITIVEKPMTVDTEWLKTYGITPLPIRISDESDGEDNSLFRQTLFDNDVLDQLAKTAIMSRTHDAVARFLAVYWKDNFYHNKTQWWFFAQHKWASDTGSFFSHKVLSELREVLDDATKWKCKKQDEALI